MNFLVDAQLPPRLCPWLEAKGHQASHVLEFSGNLSLPDSVVWEKAKDENGIILSKDWDFYERAVILSSPPQVLHIALGNCSNPALLRYLEKYWQPVEELLRQGAALISVTPTHLEVVDKSQIQ